MLRILAVLVFLAFGLAQEITVLTHSSFSWTRPSSPNLSGKRASSSASSKAATPGRP
jgi:hypothetical protein